MSIVMNEPCPNCQEQGHDQRGSNLMVFEDGGRFCNRAHHHKDGNVLYISADGSNPILDMEINGTIKYTADQFNELQEIGKFDNSVVRSIALSGMRKSDIWLVATEEEKEKMHSDRLEDESYFDKLKVKNLVSRHIKGEIAKLYNVRVGLSPDGKGIARHYYPIYEFSDGSWKGAKCRTLPKEFAYGHLGWTFGDNQMFGQHTTAKVMDSGSRMETLLLVGGECDAMASQQMLTEVQKETNSKWKNTLFHVWSPTKGEKALSEILLNKEAINKFNKIIVCFDNDDTGNKLNREVAKLFRGKCYKLSLPAGCNDPNDCLKQGRGKEFVDQWWNPVDPFEGGSLSSMNKYRDKAKIMPTMGLSWPWSSMDAITYGIRLHSLVVAGAGTGVGKTETTKKIAFHIAQVHKEPVVVIYLEEPADKTVRSFAGKLINKDLTAPPCNDKSDPDYIGMRDYTLDEANDAIDIICDNGMIMIGDLEGRKDVGSVMEVMEEAYAMGYKHFIIDNLTAFEHVNKDGKSGNKVDAVDETMKGLGTFKDENPVWIYLLSHLKKPYGERKPHEEGGSVSITDFRGAGSITFWANAVFGIERNTQAESLDDKCLTTYRNLKNRDVGYKVGSCVYALMDLSTGNLNETGLRPKEEKKFNDGTQGNEDF